VYVSPTRVSPLFLLRLMPARIALRGETEATPLQEKLNDLAELIAIIGSIVGAVFFTALLIRYFVQLGTGIPKR
jgi:P-type Ca2+ transporter type 2C